MNCPSCTVRPAAVTLKTMVGDVSVCTVCAVQGGHHDFISAVFEVTDLEYMWRKDSSQVKGDGYVAAR